jgi:hypothetical protein
MQYTDLKPKLQAAPPVLFGETNFRSRREVVTRDAANARLFEHWQSDGPSGVNNRPIYNNQPYMDMLPISGRSDHSKEKGMPTYDTKSDSSLDTNAYFQKYDITQDPRNVARELSASVSEDKYDRGTVQDKPNLSRSFTSRWLPNDYATDTNLTTLRAYESLKPSQNDTSISYRKFSSWGADLGK